MDFMPECHIVPIGDFCMENPVTCNEPTYSANMEAIVNSVSAQVNMDQIYGGMEMHPGFCIAPPYGGDHLQSPVIVNQAAHLPNFGAIQMQQYLMAPNIRKEGERSKQGNSRVQNLQQSGLQHANVKSSNKQRRSIDMPDAECVAEGIQYLEEAGCCSESGCCSEEGCCTAECCSEFLCCLCELFCSMGE